MIIILLCYRNVLYIISINYKIINIFYTVQKDECEFRMS